MEKKELTQENFDALKRRLKAANEEILKLVDERKLNHQIINLMEDRNKQLVGREITADQVIQMELERLNKLNQDYLEEIESYKRKIRELIKSD